MGWESRRGRGQYFTRSVRRAGRVVREYVGAGPKGETAAAEDAYRRSRRDVEQAAQRTERNQLNSNEAETSDLCLTVDKVVEAALAGAGYHRHDRGAWRRRRDG